MRRRMKITLTVLIGLVLSVFLAACSFPGVYSSSEQLPAAKPVPTQAALPPVRLPQDEAAHRDLTEWWYYTGHLEARDATGNVHQYGFEFVVFQGLRSDIPPVYSAHFAISDIGRGTFAYDQRRQLEPDAVLPNGTSTQGFAVGIDDWRMRGLNGHDHLQAGMANYAIDLDLQGRKPAVLHNDTGLITYGLGGFSYYYSRTNMAVAGTVQDHGRAVQVSGEAWMDHQWGNFLTEGEGGWDWYSIQLKNQSEMMIYFIHDASGTALSTYIEYVDPSGKETLLPTSSFQASVLANWTSPVTGIRYPSGWKLAINDPRLQTTLTITPLLKDQELVAYQSTGNVYWEGAVSIQARGPGANVDGQGYVELTGYTR
jgi:predicted secreted hydrolase